MKIVLSHAEFKMLINQKSIEVGDKPDQYILNVLNMGSEEYFQIPIEVEIKTRLNSNAIGDSLFTTSDKNADNIETWIDEWRSGWKKIKKTTIGDRQICITNMKEFLNSNPQYSVDIVFKARDLYFKTLKDKYGNYVLLENADNFIKKLIKETSTYKSNLYLYCEIVSDPETDFTDEINNSVFNDV